ncbi:MAG: preprotein translocase subunit YajC [Candidatus Korobacteraceae bacterium]
MITNAALFIQIAAGGIAPVLMMVGIFGIFYFLLIMPQQRRQKKWQAMLATVKSGDRVTTSGGIKGTVLSMKDDAIVLRVPPDNIKIEVARSSIVSLTTEEERS